MRKQKAIDVGFNKQTGSLQMDELNRWLDEGWFVVQTAGTEGDMLVIIEKEMDVE